MCMATWCERSWREIADRFAVRAAFAARTARAVEENSSGHAAPLLAYASPHHVTNATKPAASRGSPGEWLTRLRAEQICGGGVMRRWITGGLATLGVGV